MAEMDSIYANAVTIMKDNRQKGKDGSSIKAPVMWNPISRNSMNSDLFEIFS